MSDLDVRSGSGLVFHLGCVYCPYPVLLEIMSISKANGAGCVVDVTAASFSLGGSRRLLSGCWQYPDPLGLMVIVADLLGSG